MGPWSEMDTHQKIQDLGDCQFDLDPEKQLFEVLGSANSATKMCQISRTCFSEVSPKLSEKWFPSFCSGDLATHMGDRDIEGLPWVIGNKGTWSFISREQGIFLLLAGTLTKTFRKQGRKREIFKGSRQHAIPPSPHFTPGRPSRFSLYVLYNQGRECLEGVTTAHLQKILMP